MKNELKIFGLFFVGVSIGSLNPTNSVWGWLIPLAIATIFIGLDTYFDIRKDKEK
jgi:hypothetical protein